MTELVLDLTIVDEPGGRYAVFGDRVRVDDLTTFVPETCLRVCRWLEQHEVPYDNEPLAIFRGNSEDEWLDTEVGVPIGDAILVPSEGVEVRELPRDGGVLVGVVGLDHPRLQHEPAPRSAVELERAGLLRVVRERGGADQPVAAGRRAARRDRVAVRVARDRGDDVRVAVEQ